MTNNEIEVFEERYQATRGEIAKICDNYILNRDFDGIILQNIQIGWEDHRRIYFGNIHEDNSQLPYTRTLGYVEINELQRLSSVGVRVRIVCVWPPLLSYWEELSQYLKSRFPIITGQARIGIEGGQRTINLTQKKAGRKPDILYDQAYQRILEGDDNDVVFRWFCA